MSISDAVFWCLMAAIVGMLIGFFIVPKMETKPTGDRDDSDSDLLKAEDTVMVLRYDGSYKLHAVFWKNNIPFVRGCSEDTITALLAGGVLKGWSPNKSWLPVSPKMRTWYHNGCQDLT